jgi:hypothetical protein
MIARPSNNSIEIKIAPPFRSHVTPRGVIEPEGTIEFRTNYSEVGDGHSGYIFFVRAQNYSLEVGFTTKTFYIERDAYRLEYPLKPVFMPAGNVHFFAMWSTNQLKLTVLDESYRQDLAPEITSSDQIAAVDKRSAVLETPATIPPNSLLSWARNQAILPSDSYETNKSFYQAVVDSIESIQDIVTSFGLVNPFWDITYDGHKIVSRLPKREPDIQPTMRALLFQISIAKNFEIVPEYPVSGGNLDFLITAPLSTGGLLNSCVEFKLAHSDNLLHGLLHQLPAYMKAKACEFGVYSVLYFKGKYFNEPTSHDPHSLRLLLEKERRKAGLRDIRTMVLNLGHMRTPSKREPPD